jgi:hypothetical protein
MSARYPAKMLDVGAGGTSWLATAVRSRAFTHVGVYGTMNSTAQEGGSNNGLK